MRYVFQTAFFREKYEQPTCAYTHTHTQLCTHTVIKIHVQKQVRVRGCVVGVVRCVVIVVSLSFVFSNLKLVRSKGF